MPDTPRVSRPHASSVARALLEMPTDGSYTARRMEEQHKPSERVLIGHFSADTDVDEIVDAILATVPPDERPVEDRPNRMPGE